LPTPFPTRRSSDLLFRQSLEVTEPRDHFPTSNLVRLSVRIVRASVYTVKGLEWEPRVHDRRLDGDPQLRPKRSRPSAAPFARLQRGHRLQLDGHEAAWSGRRSHHRAS